MPEVTDAEGVPNNITDLWKHFKENTPKDFS